MASSISIAILLTLINLIGILCDAQLVNFNDGEVMKSLVSEQREFDYFLLSLQWPGTYCRTVKKCCSQNGCCRGSNGPAGFTIHGLWADYNDGTWPSCCNGPQFDETKIALLFDELNTYWPTLSCSKSSSCHGSKGLFWGHEKHGTCEFPYIKDEYDYFTKALSLYFKYNVTEMLNQSGYVASNSDKYPLQGIISAIKKCFGTPEITCTGDAVQEIRLCFNKNFEPQDCFFSSSCPSYISFPVYSSVGLENDGIAKWFNA
ncbi:endoribonuclease [Lithospermum erythrorhizon]|uniref:Endoribonuclease n=1 Tax=Lithospermum erythrorhizon TaxID=34254 RepID=A0AAV3NUR5_LITER